jgi:predicted membrane metal-binding protein
LNTTGLWTTVAALGLYHGLNPAMGWPLAVANAMAARRGRAVFATLLPLAGGHAAAVAVALAPFAWLGWYADWAAPSASAPARPSCCSAPSGSSAGAIRACSRASPRTASRGGRS